MKCHSFRKELWVEMQSYVDFLPFTNSDILRDSLIGEIKRLKIAILRLDNESEFHIVEFFHYQKLSKICDENEVYISNDFINSLINN